MNKILLIVTLILLYSLPVYALDCNKKPCHKKCIASQPESIQTQCMCNTRKRIYYHLTWFKNTGVPEYNEVCDGNFEQYRNQYCAAKFKYDDAYLTNSTTGQYYTPQYDQLCDGSYDEYLQKIQVLKQNQMMNRYINTMNRPVEVNVNHSGTVELNGTIRNTNYLPYAKTRLYY